MNKLLYPSPVKKKNLVETSESEFRITPSPPTPQPHRPPPPKKPIKKIINANYLGTLILMLYYDWVKLTMIGCPAFVFSLRSAGKHD